MKKTIHSTVILTAIACTSVYASVAPQATLDAVTDQSAKDALKAHDTVLDQVQYQVNNMQSAVNRASSSAMSAGQSSFLADSKATAAQKTADAAQTKVDAQAYQTKTDATLKTLDGMDMALQNDITNVRNNLHIATAKADLLEKRVDTVEPKVAANEAAIKKLDPMVTANTAGIVTLVNDLDKVKQDQAAVDQKQDAAATVLTNNLGAELQRRADGDKALDAKIDANQTAQKAADDAQDATAKGLRADIDQNQQSINGLVTDIQTATDKADKAQTTADDAKAAVNKLAVSTQTKINAKVDQTVYDAGQAKQDAALKTESDTRDQADRTLNVDIQLNKTAITGNKTTIDANKTAIASEATTRTAADTALNKDIQTRVTKTDYQAGQDAQDTEISKVQTTANTAQVTANDAKAAVAKEVTDRTAAIAQEAADRNTIAKVLGQRIDTKVDQTAFDADQKRQDAAVSIINGKVTANNTNVAANKAAIATKADQATVDAINTVVKSNATTITTTSQSVQKNTSAIAGNVTNITNNTTNITNNRTDITALENSQKTQDVRLKADETTEANHFQTLQAGVKQAQDTGAYAQARADKAFANADANRKALDATNQRVADNSKQLANHEQRIQDLESNNQTNFNKLEKQQNEDRKEFRAGLAGAYALSSIPQAPSDHTVGFGMGAGTFHSQNAIAAGVSARVSNNVSVKTGMSWDTQGNVGAGAGFLVSY